MSTKVQIAEGGKVYPSMKEMCRELGIDYCRFLMRIRSGRTVEESIRNGRLKRRDAGCRVGFAVTRAREIVVGGVEYRSVKEYAEALGRPYMEVWRELRKGGEIKKVGNN